MAGRTASQPPEKEAVPKDGAVAQTAAFGGVAHVDVPIESSTELARDVILGVLFVLFAAFVVALVLSSLKPGAIWILALLGGIAAFGGLVAYALGHEKRVRAAKREILAADPSQPVPIGPLQSMVQGLRRNPSLGVIARSLARCGFRGIAVRYHDRDRTAPLIEPLTIPFEACPLNEVDASFRGVAIDTADLNEAEERSETLRRLRRGWRLGGLGFVVLAGVQVFMNGFRAWMSGTLLWELLVWIAVLGVAFLVLLSPIKPGEYTWLVPGGILHRRPRWLSAKSRTHLYAAGASVLVAFPMPGRKWSWAVADGERSLTGLATELEIRTLLRAWLSPLPTPTPEMLRGLAGE